MLLPPENHTITEEFVSLKSIGYTILSLVSWSSADGGRMILPPCSSDSLSLPIKQGWCISPISKMGEFIEKSS